MDKNLLIYPMAFYAFWIFGTAIHLFRTRVRALKNKEVSMKYFQSYTAAPPPEYSRIAERHYENQFEVPTMFFSVGAMQFALGFANSLTLVLMWAFVVARVIHTFIHLGSNNILTRMKFFTTSWICILALWAQMIFFITVN